MCKICYNSDVEKKMEREIDWLYVLQFVLIIGIIVAIVLFIVAPELKGYLTYNKFCNERPDYCYCDWGLCNYKITETLICNSEGNCSSSFVDNNTMDLCNLAKELNDKRTIFKACPKDQ